MAGRPFFMRIGVDQTSTAPAASTASNSGATSSGLMSSMLASTIITASAGVASARPSGSPISTRSTLGRSASSRVPAP